jgi:hypothetical protein
LTAPEDPESRLFKLLSWLLQHKRRPKDYHDSATTDEQLAETQAARRLQAMREKARDGKVTREALQKLEEVR